MIARIVFQLLQFIVSADASNRLQRNIRMKNMFAVQRHSLELAKLAVRNFRVTQLRVEIVRDTGWMEPSSFILFGSLSRLG